MEDFDVIFMRWQKTVEDSSFTLGGISRLYDVPYKNLANWFYHGVVPHKKNIERMEIIMTDLKKRGGANPLSSFLWLCHGGTNRKAEKEHYTN